MNPLRYFRSAQASPAVRPLAETLPRLTLEAAAARRIGFDARLPAMLRDWLGDESVHIGAAQPAANALLAEVEVRSGVFTVALEPHETVAWSLLDDLLRANKPGAADLACPVATELLQREAARRGVDARGVRVRRMVHEAMASEPAPVPMIEVAGLRLWLTAIDSQFGLALLEALQNHETPPKRRWRDLAPRGVLYLQERCMSRSLLASLGAGDWVIVGQRRLQAQWCAGAGASHGARATLDYDENRITVDTPLSRINGELTMSEPQVIAIDHQLGELSLPIRFEIDTTSLTLDELETLAPGYVIALNSPLREAAVRISCGGVFIGSGQLIAVGEHLGVRIERLAAPAEDHARH
jgi:type III secretion protein Q